MYLISYDISSNRIRQKVAKELENYGQRVQYSVFECRITKKQMEKLYEKMMRLIQGDKQASVRIYFLCTSCEGKVQLMGIEQSIWLLEEEDLFII